MYKICETDITPESFVVVFVLSVVLFLDWVWISSTVY